MSHFKKNKEVIYFSDKLKIKLDGSFLTYIIWDYQAQYHKEVVIQIQRGSLVLEEWTAELKIKLSVLWHKRPQKL